MLQGLSCHKFKMQNTIKGHMACMHFIVKKRGFINKLKL